MNHLAPPTRLRTGRRRAAQSGGALLAAMGLVVTVLATPSLADDAAEPASAPASGPSLAQCRDRATDAKPVADDCDEHRVVLLKDAAERREAAEKAAAEKAAAEKAAEEKAAAEKAAADQAAAEKAAADQAAADEAADRPSRGDALAPSAVGDIPEECLGLEADELDECLAGLEPDPEPEPDPDPETCPEGQVLDEDGVCVPEVVEPEPCDQAEVRNDDGECVPEPTDPETCPEGQVLDEDGVCVPEITQPEPSNPSQPNPGTGNGGVGSSGGQPEGTLTGEVQSEAATSCADTTVCQVAAPVTTGLPDTGAPEDQGLLLYGAGLLLVGGYLLRPQRAQGRHRLERVVA